MPIVAEMLTIHQPADNYGSHDVFQGSHAPAIKSGTQWPMYDPFSVSDERVPSRHSPLLTWLPAGHLGHGRCDGHPRLWRHSLLDL
jgi:hypothetical protein